MCGQGFGTPVGLGLSAYESEYLILTEVLVHFFMILYGSEHKIFLIWLCFYCQVKELELIALAKISSGLDLCRERNQN